MLVIFVVLILFASDCVAIHIGLVTEQTQLAEQEADLELDESQREKLKEMVHAEQEARALAKEQSQSGLDQLQQEMQQGLMKHQQKSGEKAHTRKHKHHKKKAKKESEEPVDQPQNQIALTERFGPKTQEVFTPSVNKPHRSALQEPDEILGDGLDQEDGQTVQTSDDPDAEFWSQVESDDPPKPAVSKDNDPDSVDSYGDALNQASNEDMFAFSQVASSDVSVQQYLKSQEPEIGDAEGDPQQIASFIGDLQAKSSKISEKDVELLRKSMGLKPQAIEQPSEDDQAPEDFAAQFAVSIEQEQQAKKKSSPKPAQQQSNQFKNDDAKKQSRSAKKENKPNDEDEDGSNRIESLVQSEFDVAHDEVEMDD